MTSISSPKMISLGDGVAMLNADDKPFVFIDACSFLDVLRIPLPERKNTIGMMLAALKLNELIINKIIYSFSSEICIKEYNDHATEQINAYQPQIQTIQKPIHALIDFINQSGLSGSKFPKIDFTLIQLERFFCDLVESLVKHTFFIQHSQEILEKAGARTIDRKPPAKKKGEYKDCIVWETFRALRNGQTSKSNPAFFLSSNKSDYCEGGNSWDFHPDLQTEVASLNCFYALDFVNLETRLKTARIVT